MLFASGPGGFYLGACIKALASKFISVKDDEKRSVWIVQNLLKLIGVFLIRFVGAASSVTVTILQFNYRLIICPDAFIISRVIVLIANSINVFYRMLTRHFSSKGVSFHGLFYLKDI